MSKVSTREDASVSDAKTVVINIPAAGSLFGLGAVIEWLLLGAAWMCYGIGWICVPGVLAGCALGLVALVMNFGSLAAVLVCLGGALACLGACVPLYWGMRLALAPLVRASRGLMGRPAESTGAVKVPANQRRILLVSAALLACGCALWGVGALMGGMEGLALPAILAGIAG